MTTLTVFHAEWCGPCQRTLPALEAVNVPKLSFDIDTDVGLEAAKRYGVKSVPTIVFNDEDGNELERLTGAQTQADIEAVIARRRAG